MKLRSALASAGAILTVALAALPARAHFLWAKITPGDAPTVQLMFSETPNEATPESLIAKVRPVNFRADAGEIGKPTATLIYPLAPNARTASAEQIWGVLDRTEQKRGVFLLHYYAKAALSEGAAGTVAEKSPMEVVAVREGKILRVEARQDGFPIPQAKIMLFNGETILSQTADLAGKAAFDVSAAPGGLTGIRAETERKTPGVYEGKKYETIRHYATLTFPMTVGEAFKAGTKETKTADPAAWASLKGAHDNRLGWAKNLAAVDADITFNNNGKIVTGKAAYSPEKGATVDASDASDDGKQWLVGQISNLMGHRRGGDFAQGDGKNPITFTKEDNSPLGRQVALNDSLQSFYRVRENVVTEVTRTMGDSTFTITVLETEKPSDGGGKYLPRHFVVTYFDAKTGAIQKTDSYTDAHAKIAGSWIPVSRRVVTAENGAFVTRIVELKNIRLR